jgi:hypothetical protein
MKNENELPESVDLKKYMPPVVDQGQLGSSVCCAVAGLIQRLRDKSSSYKFRSNIYFKEILHSKESTNE